ncbi:MAG: acetyl-CoA synthase subunit gamma [Syntrophaceae bacterium]|nr:acetyl-CoA synthase subunit gamma [Syntrophaceae bacterium]
MKNLTLPVIQNNFDCCAPVQSSGSAYPSIHQPFVAGSFQTTAGIFPQVLSNLTWVDRWENIKARWGAGRMNYSIEPGLYALNNPDAASPVLVTANYKMSFDKLRQALAGRNLWILVLDTKGINVWCAAGKGTFGTEELISKIETGRIKEIVSHRKIILPQLGAPGVAAHEVKKRTGFKVFYGPIRARDLAVYLDGGYKADTEMRTMTFPLKDRALLIPIELVATIKPFLILSLCFFLLAGIGGPGNYWGNLFHYGIFSVAALSAAVFAGAVLSPVLLPYLPGRAFSIKGFSIGMIVAIVLLYVRGVNFSAWPDKIEALSWLLIIPAIASYLAMNFTGATTYTSPSGVKKEMRFALPIQICAAICGILLWLTSRVIS